MVYNQFHKKIKILRSDNAKEYFCREVNNYMEENGIIHQSSCVSTPQQNGVAERKIGHDMSTAMALLFQGNCPKSYWSEAVATATHLINRTPSKVLNLSTPIDILSLRTNLPTKIFGCIVYAHVHNVGKLEHQSLKCIFLGYSPTQKGYKCYHPTSRKLLITADVIFDEQSMFYPQTEGQLDSFLPDLKHGEGSDEDQYRLTSHVREQVPTTDSISSQIKEENAIRPDIEQVEDDSPPETDVPSNHGWPIAINKGVRKCTKNKLYPIGNFVSYSSISPEYNQIIQAPITVSIPKTV